MIPTLNKVFRIKYKNYRGEISDRNIRINNFTVGSNEYHKEHQLLIDAEDIDKKENRFFAAKDVLIWYEKE